MSVDLVIFQLEQQSEAVELNNSILIEISKTAVVKWQEKLKTRYGWFKTNNCKNIIFDVSIFVFIRILMLFWPGPLQTVHGTI